MPKITIRNVPKGLDERRKQQAAQNRRRLNSELLYILEEAVETSIGKNGKYMRRLQRIHVEILLRKILRH